jgi:adenosylmethionine-8-amino-7-oxononanoate aminotransferase
MDRFNDTAEAVQLLSAMEQVAAFPLAPLARSGGCMHLPARTWYARIVLFAA